MRWIDIFIVHYIVPSRDRFNKISANPCKSCLTLQFFHSPCRSFCWGGGWNDIISSTKRFPKLFQNHVKQPDLLITQAGNSQSLWSCFQQRASFGDTLLSTSRQKTKQFSGGRSWPDDRCPQMSTTASSRTVKEPSGSTVLMLWSELLALLCFGT